MNAHHGAITKNTHIPDFPGTRETMYGSCTNPMALVMVKESTEHPGYMDFTISNEREVVSTTRPVRRGELAKGMLASMIADEYPRGVDLKWRTEKTPPRRERDPGGVYFITAEGTNMVKIGYSNHPQSRLDSLQTGSPVPLKIVATLPGGLKGERALHKKFAAYRSHGEWFYMDQVISDFIEEIKYGR